MPIHLYIFALSIMYHHQDRNYKTTWDNLIYLLTILEKCHCWQLKPCLLLMNLVCQVGLEMTQHQNMCLFSIRWSTLHSIIWQCNKPCKQDNSLTSLQIFSIIEFWVLGLHLHSLSQVLISPFEFIWKPTGNFFSLGIWDLCLLNTA